MSAPIQLERPAYLVEHEDVFSDCSRPDVLLVNVCRNCQAAMSSCVCTSPVVDEIPIWRDGQGENKRLVAYLRNKRDQHRGDVFQSPEEMKSRQTLWNPVTLEDWAMYCVRRGWYVFPCLPRSKAPATGHGFKDSSNDISQIREWWKQNPNYNPAIDLGRSNLVVYDFDAITPFKTQPTTFTVQTGRDPAKNNGIRGVQMYYQGSAKTHGFNKDGLPAKKGEDSKTDSVGEVRSRGAYVMACGAVHPSGNRYQIISNLPLAPSPEQNVEEVTVHSPAVGSDEQNSIGDYVEGAFDLAGIDYRARDEHNGGFKWFIVCPWKSEHTTGKDFDTSSAVIMWPSGKLIYECKHGHCQGIRQWKDLRFWMEEKAGEKLVFGDPKEVVPIIMDGKQINDPNRFTMPPAIVSAPEPTRSAPEFTQSAVNPLSLPFGDYSEESDIPPFDPSVIGQDNIFRRFVDLISTGTGIPDQFAFAIAKAVVGMRMDGNVTFDGHDIRPNLYVALIGPTGTGKSVAWKRMLDIIRPAGSLVNSHSPCMIKLIDSFDSGAGLKEAFKQHPESEPILCFVDEVEDLGSKSAGTRQPEILTTIIQLKEGTTISRVLKKGTWTKTDARLGMILCGQEGAIFTRALAGRTKLGLWDRMYPEFSPVQESTKLAKVDPLKAYELLAELNSMDYSATMTISSEAKAVLNEFWNSLLPVDRKIRWKNDLLIDTFMAAFGRRAKEVSASDAIAAVKIARRQIIIRKVCFTTEVPDKTGYYLGLIKKITRRMEQRLAAGENEEIVAKSKRDYLTGTHAYRDNEDHYFEKAWMSHEKTFLRKVKIRKANGQEYEKFLPSLHD